MKSFDEALATLLDLAGPLDAEAVGLADAHQRVLAEPALARRASPSAAVSAMDSYAVHDADLGAGETALRLVGESRAGDSGSQPLVRGTCLRVFTGAPVPLGASRVVLQEEARRDGGLVVFRGPCQGRSHIRPAGSDFNVGDVLVEAGTWIDAPRLVALAAADLSKIKVVRRPRVRVIATGDEIREPGAGGDGVPDSVSFGVAALATEWGAVVVGRARVRDDLFALQEVASTALADADIVVVTGGASVGERDFGRAMFAAAGLALDVDKVAMKPGKPVWVGRCQGRFVVGLPGNPTSAMVTARLLLAPLIATMAGRDPADAVGWRWTTLGADLSAGGERETFVRAARSQHGVAPVGDQDAAAQAALAHCDALIRLAPGERSKVAGEPVQILEF